MTPNSPDVLKASINVPRRCPICGEYHQSDISCEEHLKRAWPKRYTPTPALPDDELVERLTRYDKSHPSVVSSARGTRTVYPLVNPDGPEAAARLATLSTLLSERDAEIERLTRDNTRLQGLTYTARAKSKAKGLDLLREEADAALSAFGAEWELLRDIAKRTGDRSASWLASRARDLQERGLVESRWIGKERTSSLKVWRLSEGRLVPITTSGQMPAPHSHERIAR